MPEVMGRLARAYGRRRILVTGGASFIGIHLCELLVQSGAKVTVADDFSSGKRTNLDPIASRITIFEGDLRNPDFATDVLGGQEVVFHLAASHGGHGYIDTHPIECTNNMLLDHVVFAVAADAGCVKSCWRVPLAPIRPIFKMTRIHACYTLSTRASSALFTSMSTPLVDAMRQPSTVC